MSGPEVTYVPDARDGRCIVVLNGDRVTHYRVLEARALYVRLGRALDEATLGLQVSGPERMSDYQRRRLHALLAEHGAKGDDRFPVLARILDRPIGSTNDLTPDEADECIDVLQRTRSIRPGTQREGAF